MRARRVVLVLLALALTAGAAIAVRRALSLSPIVAPAIRPSSASRSLSGATMGSTWSVQLRRPLQAAAAARMQSSIQRLLDRLEGEMSNYRPDSDVSQFNFDRGDDWRPVPPDLAAVMAESMAISEATGGAFDVTVAPLVQCWGFGPKAAGREPRTVPSQSEIDAARRHVGFRRIEVRLAPPALRKVDPHTQIDLGGIGKGYAADAVGRWLEAHGAADYLVEVGGELRARGQSHLARPWRVGIESPDADPRRVCQRVELSDLSIATSGDYRQCFEKNGERYSHVIDPRTGRPATHELASVSVVDPSASRADALATALIVLGPERGFNLAQDQGIAALFLTRRNGGLLQRRETAGFRRLLIDAPIPAKPSAGGEAG